MEVVDIWQFAKIVAQKYVFCVNNQVNNWSILNDFSIENYFIFKAITASI